MAARLADAQQIAALLAIRDELIAECLHAECAIGTWEDDGGAPPPEGARRFAGLLVESLRGIGSGA